MKKQLSSLAAFDKTNEKALLTVTYGGVAKASTSYDFSLSFDNSYAYDSSAATDTSVLHDTVTYG